VDTLACDPFGALSTYICFFFYIPTSPYIIIIAHLLYLPPPLFIPLQNVSAEKEELK
jgi:hypothetical protein